VAKTKLAYNVVQILTTSPLLLANATQKNLFVLFI